MEFANAERKLKEKTNSKKLKNLFNQSYSFSTKKLAKMICEQILSDQSIAFLFQKF